MSIASTHPGRAAASRAQAAARENSSDEALIKRIAAGDRLAMQTLFARHRVAVYRWLLRLVNEEALAEDLLSEVFLAVWRQAASFEARASVSTWLLAIARYKALSARRPRSASVHMLAAGCAFCYWRPGVRSAIGGRVSVLLTWTVAVQCVGFSRSIYGNLTRYLTPRTCRF
jgi:hypothetical protein